MPGARHTPVSWKDVSGDFWLFGGYGFSGDGGLGRLNDLWKWDGTSWTWMSGSDTVGQGGTYGTEGLTAPGNVPGSRSGSVSWTDASGNGWLFGGEGLASPNYGTLNDPEVGRDELDLGERVGRGEPPWNIRDEGRSRAAERTQGERFRRLLEGHERELLALRGQCLSGLLWKPERPLEVGRDELDLGERLRLGGPVRNVWNEGRGDAGERPRGRGSVPSRGRTRAGATGSSVELASTLSAGTGTGP